MTEACFFKVTPKNSKIEKICTCVIKSLNNNNNNNNKTIQNIHEEIPGNHIKEPHKIATLGTAHVLRKILV
jgi:hypothetical protein